MLYSEIDYHLHLFFMARPLNSPVAFKIRHEITILGSRIRTCGLYGFEVSVSLTSQSIYLTSNSQSLGITIYRLSVLFKVVITGLLHRTRRSILPSNGSHAAFNSKFSRLQLPPLSLGFGGYVWVFAVLFFAVAKRLHATIVVAAFFQFFQPFVE